MNKSRLANCLGIMLAFGIALGGLFFVRNMLEESKEVMLSQKGQVEVARLFPEAHASRQERAFLTGNELFQIINNMESDKEEYPHEPIEGQLSMEQAVERSKEWVEELCTQYLNAETLLPAEYKKITASLCIKPEEGGMDGHSYLYSYWRITLTGEHMEAELLLNAVTGLALDTAIYSRLPEISFEQINVEELLTVYVDGFGFEEGNIERQGTGVYMRLGQEDIYAAVRTVGIAVNRVEAEESELDSTTIFQLCLTTTKVW